VITQLGSNKKCNGAIQTLVLEQFGLWSLLKVNQTIFGDTNSLRDTLGDFKVPLKLSF